ncbi:hypothetical protein MTO96_043482 [Rhipicephalus appendiculatus]
MSRSDYPYPENDPNVFRYDLPRYTHGDEGQLLMEPLRTEDLPEPPPRATTMDTRLVVTLVCVTLLASTTITATTFILVRYSAMLDSDDEITTTQRSRLATVLYGTKSQPVNATSDEIQWYLNRSLIFTNTIGETSSSIE